MSCALLALTSVLLLLSENGVGRVAIIVLLLGLFLLARWHSDKQVALFGFLTPLAPVFGSSTLPAIAFAFLFFHRDKLRGGEIKWAIPFLFVAAVWVVAQLVVEHSLYAPLLDLFAARDGLLPATQKFLDLLAAGAPRSWSTLELFLTLVLIPLFVSFFRTVPSWRNVYMDGLVAGSAFAALMTIAQWAAILPAELTPVRQSFWVGVQRFSGTFQDPNSCGVFLGLALPLLIFEMAKHKRFTVWSIAAYLLLICAAGLLSGSRSFLLSLLATMAVGAFIYNRKWFVAALVAIVLLASIVTLDGLPDTLTAKLPPPAYRIVESLNLERASAQFSTRTVFIKIAMAVIEESPLIGVGLNRFSLFVPGVAQALNLGTGVWSDNANNFYLGVLAEMGLVGFLALLLSCFGRRFESGSSIGRIQLVVLLGLLLVGPHIFFAEVAILSALIIGIATSPRPMPGAMVATAALSPLLIAAVGMRMYSNEWGVEEYQREPLGFTRWLRKDSQFFIDCSEQQSIKFRFMRTLNLRVDVNGEPRDIRGTPGKIATLDLHCLGSGSMVKRLRTHSESTWTAASVPHLGEDVRPITAQIVFEAIPSSHGSRR